MFLAFAQQYVAPDSWLGTRVTTGEGRFWLSLFLAVSMTAIGYGLREFIALISKSGKSGKNKSNRPPGDGSP